MAVLIGMIVGGMVLIYFIRMLLLFLFHKFLKVEVTRTATNLALVLAVIFSTMFYYIAENEVSFSYVIGGFILFLLGLIPDKKAPVDDAS